jgi:hypothetical protein
MGRHKTRRGGKRADAREVERRQAFEERQQLSCESKTAYPSEAEARRAAGWVKAQNPGQHQMRVYECAVCRRWHMTRAGR